MHYTYSIGYKRLEYLIHIPFQSKITLSYNDYFQ